MPLLTAKELTIKIAHTIICHAFDFTLKKGDCVGILGLNGSGKTTLLHTLAGLILPASGHIDLQEKKLTHYSSKEMARIRGILLQDTPIFFPETVLDFCLHGRYPHLNFFQALSKHDKDIAREALCLMNLLKKEAQNVETLSGGERRRLAIAALLTQTPQIYLLDEPTNHLDWPHQIKILNYFSDLAKKNLAGVMMTLHDVNFAKEYCNKVVLLLKNGEVLTGDTKTLITKENMAKVYETNMTNLGYAAASSCIILGE
ncbi:MAG: hypothetical protein ACD_60C00097G0009 [uncultured bacterium]|nr:MAG: hypothetical protein ACD_60C00097G0009 [uncultured bacterium]